MRQIQQPGAGVLDPPVTLLSFGYDNLGRRISIGRANGATTSYSYDNARLSQLSHDFAGTSHDLSLGFGYNEADQITSNTRSNDVYAWTGHGSGTTESLPNGLNQIVSHGGASLSHDAKGNVTYDPAAWLGYGYSAENLLTTVNGSGWTGSLRYDPLMRLYEAGVSGKARAVYDGDTRIAEYDSSGALRARFVHGPGIDEPLIEYSGSGLPRRFLHADERGSIIAGSNNAGNVSYVGRYDEYGKPGPTNYSRFGFTGHPYETLTELYDAGARMYNPRLPRFMQIDPKLYEDGPNGYAYVQGDPVNQSDPDGQEAACITSGANCLRPSSNPFGDMARFIFEISSTP